VEVNTDINDEPLALLVDSGSDLCLNNEQYVQYLKDINENNVCYIKGISLQTLQTLSTINVSLIFNEMEYNQEFHIVQHDFPIPHNGIIGRNFFKSYNVSVDYGDEDRLYFRQSDFSVPTYQLGVR
jgi:hypothetical protein